jgi:hypothetical protein
LISGTVASILVLALTTASGATASNLAPPGWSVTRVLTQRIAQPPVELPARRPQLVTGLNRWALYARNDGGTEVGARVTFRLRERVPGRGWGRPRNVPSKVSAVAADSNDVGVSWVVFRKSGQTYAAQHTPAGKRLEKPETIGGSQLAFGRKGGVEVGEDGHVVVWDSDEHMTERQPDGSWTDAAPITLADGSQPRVASSLWLRYASGDDLLAMWVDYRNDYALTVARRSQGAWSAPQVLGDGHLSGMQLIRTSRGVRLVAVHTITRDVLVMDYQTDASTGGFSFKTTANLSGPEANDRYPRFQALRDDAGRLAVLLTEQRRHGGVLAWQPDRPHGPYLHTPTRVPGTRGAGDTWSAAMSPGGNITVAYVDRDHDKPRPTTVTHLPAGRSNWTTADRLLSPKPFEHGVTLGLLGWQAQSNGDVTLHMIDRAGTIAWLFRG